MVIDIDIIFQFPWEIYHQNPFVWLAKVRRHRQT